MRLIDVKIRDTKTGEEFTKLVGHVYLSTAPAKSCIDCPYVCSSKCTDIVKRDIENLEIIREEDKE